MGIKYTCDRCGKETPVLYRFVIYGEGTDLNKFEISGTDGQFCKNCFNEMQKKIVKLIKEETN